LTKFNKKRGHLMKKIILAMGLLVLAVFLIGCQERAGQAPPLPLCDVNTESNCESEYNITYKFGRLPGQNCQEYKRPGVCEYGCVNNACIELCDKASDYECSRDSRYLLESRTLSSIGAPCQSYKANITCEFGCSAGQCKEKPDCTEVTSSECTRHEDEDGNPVESSVQRRTQLVDGDENCIQVNITEYCGDRGCDKGECGPQE
jgi:hypothetical protein